MIMSKYFDKKYSVLNRYVPGEQPQDKKYIKLNTNESPYPPSQLVIDRVNSNEVADLRLYSDPECKNLKEKLASRYGLKPENIYLSNGSDDILNFAFMAYCSDGKKVVFPDITYGFYSVYAQLHCSRAEIIPLDDDFRIDVSKYCDVDGMIVLANPNAPTGLTISLNDIELILKSNLDNVVVIDEAYIDFGGKSCLPLLSKYSNLLIVRTFSKSRSLAGARLGFAMASEEIISDLETLRYSTNPYNINRLTLIAGEGAIDSDSYFFDNCKKIEETRQKTTNELKKLGFVMTDSKANFIFAKHPDISGNDLYLMLKEKGILIRHFTSERIKDYNRITVGSEYEMDEFIKAVKEILDEV